MCKLSESFLATVPKPGSFCCGNKRSLQNPWFFLMREQKGLPATVRSKTIVVSVAGRNGCFKTEEGYVLFWKMIVGRSVFAFLLVAGAR